MADNETKVAIRHADGRRGMVPASELPLYEKGGWRPETLAESKAVVDQQEFGDSPGTAFAQGAARTITLGGSDVFLDALDQGEDARKTRQQNPVAGTLGEVTGAVLPVGGGALATGAGKLAGGAVRGAGTTAGARVAGGIATGAAEGGVFGVGQGVSELALSDDPLTAERVASTLGSNVLFGAGFGGAVGGAGGALAEGARAAKKFGQRTVEKMSAQADAAAAEARLSDDLLVMDRPTLKKTREAELARVKAEREAAVPEGIGRMDRAELTKARKVAADEARVAAREEGQAVIGELKAYVDETRPLFAKADGGQLIGGLGASKKRLMRTLDDPKGWVESPWAAHSTATSLRKQEAILVDALASPKLALADDARGVAESWLAKNRSAQARIGGFTERLKNPTSPKLSELDDAIASFTDRQAALRAPFESPRLAEIDDALATFGSRAKPGLAETIGKGTAAGTLGSLGMALGLPPVAAFPLGAAAADAAVDAVLSRFGRRIAKSADGAKASSSAALDKFFDVTGKGAKAAFPQVTKVLSATQYATPEQVKARPARPMAPTKNPRVQLFRERAAELGAVVDYGPDGKPRMSSSAMRQLSERLAGVAALSPKLADQMLVAAARRVEFLASKLPKRPGMPSLQVGPDTWRPSEMDMAKFARFADAVDNPGEVLERMASSRMTSEDAEALRVVYPETYAALQMQIMERLPELRQKLPYDKRLMLSVFFRRPVDPSMQPEVMKIFQGNFKNEPGTGGGMQPARPNFSSLRGNNKAPEATPAQKRAG